MSKGFFAENKQQIGSYLRLEQFQSILKKIKLPDQAKTRQFVVNIDSLIELFLDLKQMYFQDLTCIL